MVLLWKEAADTTVKFKFTVHTSGNFVVVGTTKAAASHYQAGDIVSKDGYFYQLKDGKEANQATVPGTDNTVWLDLQEFYKGDKGEQ